jgi:transposase
LCRWRARVASVLGWPARLRPRALRVIECEQPNRKARRGKGKSDPIDAHLAVLAALRLDADRLPEPRADGDREALRILLGARQELSVAATAQTNRLRALLLSGDDIERDMARATLTDPVLLALARRREPRHASLEQTVRHGEIRRRLRGGVPARARCRG